MKVRFALFFAIAGMFSANAGCPDDIYLLIGQSNMAGRGYLTEENRLSPGNAVKWEDGAWVPAGEPLWNDCEVPAGAGPGLSFALEMSASEGGKTIGLVPAAVGGTALKEWLPDCRYYTNAVERCRAALAGGGRLKGILWHQGCADSVKQGDAESYADRLTVLVSALRKEFGDVPFVAGEVGRFLDNYVWKGPDGREVRLGHWRTVNEQIHLAASRIGRMRVVCSDGLADRGDSLHFDTPSQRILGRRYAKAMKELLADGAGRAVQASE